MWQARRRSLGGACDRCGAVSIGGDGIDRNWCDAAQNALDSLVGKSSDTLIGHSWFAMRTVATRGTAHGIDSAAVGSGNVHVVRAGMIRARTLLGRMAQTRVQLHLRRGQQENGRARPKRWFTPPWHVRSRERRECSEDTVGIASTISPPFCCSHSCRWLGRLPVGGRSQHLCSPQSRRFASRCCNRCMFYVEPRV